MCNILDVSSDLSAWPLNLLEYNAYVPRSITAIQSLIFKVWCVFI